jgi:hypothetical protein
MSSVQVISDICVGNKQDNREAILAYEEVAKEFPQVDIPVTHHIHGGMYGREITIPAGTIITGQLYKFDHFDVMISGDITVSTDTGETKRLTGYNCFKGLSGKKRAGYAHADTTWITFHAVKGTDGEEIQRFLTVDSFEDLRKFEALVNREDYKQMIAATQMTEEQVRQQVENTEDLVQMPEGHDHFYVSDSLLQGQGFFSSTKLLAGSLVCPARLEGLRTPAGRYINHAVNANSRMRITAEGVYVEALRDIEAHEEITINYRRLLSDRRAKGDLCQE